MFLDRFIEREIQSMVVHCVHHDQGCDWKDELKKREVYSSRLFNNVAEELISYFSLLFSIVLLSAKCAGTNDTNICVTTPL